MADPVTGALVAQGVAGGASALGSMGAARAERSQANRNAFIADTRAIQTGTTFSEDLGDELATLRNTLVSSGQEGGMEFWRELNKVRRRAGRVAIANERQQAGDFRTQGRNAMAQGRVGAISGAATAARAGFDLWGGR